MIIIIVMAIGQCTLAHSQGYVSTIDVVNPTELSIRVHTKWGSGIFLLPPIALYNYV